ncbi:MAG: CPBP family intramembrane metalloprotease, partial [Xanthomonadales bacterium]|nr:CPBP family intramembrane metalloprotease [Xanthomonadales bacterium]
MPQSKPSALLDLAVLVAVIMAAWSLRFIGIENVGAITMAVALLTVFVILKLRRQGAGQIGLGPIPPARMLLQQALRLLPWFAGAWLVGGFVGVALFGPPQTASAVSELPAGLWTFLLDITVVTWVLIAFGEETVFRGFVLDRLLVLAGSERQGTWLAILLQAAWFGSLHASQGASGMIMT